MSRYKKLSKDCAILPIMFFEFVMERFQSLYENEVDFNLSDSGVHPLTIGDLLNEEEIQHFFDNMLFVEDGFVEGGDILNINNHFIIGLSDRTNKLGAENLSNILHKLGATVEICKTPDDVLHFKSECSALDDDVILVSSKMAQLDYLKSNYQLIELPIGEEGAANTLRINDKLLLPDGFIKAEEMLSKKYNIIKIKVDEIAKVDAGLSCMSLRW